MNKQFQQRNWVKGFCIIVLILTSIMVLVSFNNKDYFWLAFFIIFAIPSAILSYILVSRFRISINEDGIYIEANKIMKMKQLKWDEIGWVVDDHWIGLHVYHLVPNSYGKQRITIPAGVKNKEDLFKEIIRRAPQAKIEESIKQLVAKSR